MRLSGVIFSLPFSSFSFFSYLFRQQSVLSARFFLLNCPSWQCPLETLKTRPGKVTWFQFISLLPLMTQLCQLDSSPELTLLYGNYEYEVAFWDRVSPNSDTTCHICLCVHFLVHNFIRVSKESVFKKQDGTKSFCIPSRWYSRWSYLIFFISVTNQILM